MPGRLTLSCPLRIAACWKQPSAPNEFRVAGIPRLLNQCRKDSCIGECHRWGLDFLNEP
ncbi:hypothetical protein CIT292_07585 [Citrobacter youngae ATCC 29220]|uniref:Uncharacterized protein n=1 Tax=Citrobacter youngae ATCC 29220 TaxID=500640 RepID=D4BAU1_9ENTR|nr:hypothetical protein CIT292_07585 [Citrobacter youngae ATCC 29220]